MATLSEALNEIATGYWINEDEIQGILSGFESMVRKNGIGIYYFRAEDGSADYDVMGESTEWQALYEESPNTFDVHTTIKMYNDGFLFDENTMFVYISNMK